ncbi:MAG: TonB-dependent receptor [Proteobacteria bacterium]|nr:TonB-dependent receptor [Pseudomonadota bacterium]
MKERNPIQDAVRYALTAGVAASFASIPSMAFAQDDEDVAEQGLIEVTGSRIKRVDVEGPSPVAIITRADIENSGDISVADVLRQSSYNQFGSFRQRSGSSAQSQATISLRGLGAQRTLVLLDGRRIAGSPTFGAGSAQNLNTIPIAAVERIEILRDGASAIYGADAVGGVVNIIMRKDYEGLQISAEVGRPTQDGGDENAYSIVGGITSGKGNITFALDHSDSEIIFNGDRTFSAVGLSSFGFPGSFAITAPAGTVDNNGDTVFSLGIFPDARCPNSINTDPTFANSRINTGNGLCNYNYAATSANEASLTRDTMFVNGNYQVNEDLNFFARGTFSRTQSFGRYAPAPQVGGSPFLPSMSAANPNNPTAPGAYLTAGLPSNYPLPFAGATDLSQFDTDGDGVPDITGPFDLSIFYRNVPGGFRDSNVTTLLYDYLIGFEGSSDMFGGLDWDAGFQYSRQTNDDTSDGLAFRGGLQAVIDDGTFDIFNVQGNGTDAAIAAGFGHQGFHNEVHRITSGDFTATWDAFQMSAGPVPVVLGVEYRDEKFSQDYDAQQNAGNVDGSAGGADVQGSRSVLAFYAETSLPITEDIELSLAGRFDSYNDFGTTVNPKIAVGFRPTDTLLLRASWGEGFRAPSMSQLYSSPAQSFNGAIDAVRCAATAEGDPVTGRSAIPVTDLPIGHACLTTQYQNFTGGNVNLNAELSEGFNVGIVFNPIDDLSISLDYYSIDLVDQITALPLQTILDAELINMGSAEVIRGGNGRINFIAQNLNLAGTKTNGLDLDLRYSFSAGGVGDFTTQLTWSHVNNYVFDTNDGSGFNDVAFSPDDRIQWNLNWSLSDYSATLIGNYINSTPVGGGVILDDWTTWDLQLNWATPWNGRLTIGARNLFDKDPPLNPAAASVLQQPAARHIWPGAVYPLYAGSVKTEAAVH